MFLKSSLVPRCSLWPATLDGRARWFTNYPRLVSRVRKLRMGLSAQRILLTWKSGTKIAVWTAHSCSGLTVCVCSYLKILCCQWFTVLFPM
jgi:hypothetical protein